MLGGVKRWIIGVAVLACIAAAIGFWNDARQSAFDDIKEQNNEAGSAADSADIGYLGCLDAGGVGPQSECCKLNRWEKREVG
jgi:hypothetical protein